MSEEKIEILYKMLMKDLVLNDRSLRAYGFTDEEIDELIMSNVLALNDNGSYKLVKVDKFRHYGVKLLLNKNAGDANRCFRKCYELAPNGRDICLQSLLAAVKIGNYKRAFEIFANLEKIQPTKNTVNNNLYLYLLNFITECPEEYAERASLIGALDFSLPYSIGNRIENEVRGAILEHKFTYAIRKINDIIAKSNNYSVKFQLIKELLSQTIDCERRFESTLMKYVKTKQYDKVVIVLKTRRKKIHLTNYEAYVLLIAEEILKVLQTRRISEPKIGATDDLYQALVGNNFKLAYEINKEFIEFINGNENEDIINILLVDLNNMIAELKEDYDMADVSDKRAVIFQEQSELDRDIEDAKDIVEYILSQGMTIDAAKKRLGLKIETVLLVKLVYVRDYCYKDGSDEKLREADLILQEVELCENKSAKVICLLNEIKAIGTNSNKKVLAQ